MREILYTHPVDIKLHFELVPIIGRIPSHYQRSWRWYHWVHSPIWSEGIRHCFLLHYPGYLIPLLTPCNIFL
uniref:Uncharacterized protein n=1 Tax=Lepeophtheirus salmonis TaxID=72036 RepID=A0A0K2V7S1_LEPSM